MNSTPSSDSARFLFSSFQSSTSPFAHIMASVVCTALLSSIAAAQPASHACSISQDAGIVQVRTGIGVIELQMIAGDILRVDAEPLGKTSPRTLVIDPSLRASGGGRIELS